MDGSHDWSREGFLALLFLGVIVGVSACVYVFLSVEAARPGLFQFGPEVPRITRFYLNGVSLFFALPIVLSALTLAITRIGKERRTTGLILVACIVLVPCLLALGTGWALDMPFQPLGTDRVGTETG